MDRNQAWKQKRHQQAAAILQNGREMFGPPDDNEGEMVRLSKMMSELAMCSRREADRHILAGNVLVNGVAVNELGAKVPRDARIELVQTAIAAQASLVTILVHKPPKCYAGGQSSRPHVRDYLAREHQSPTDTRVPVDTDLKNLAACGLLAMEAEGLVVYSQDGRIAKALTDPIAPIEREYVLHCGDAMSSRRVTAIRSRLRIRSGTTPRSKLDWLGNGLMRCVLSDVSFIELTRAMATFDIQPMRVVRTRIGNVSLTGLACGQWRFLRPDERF